MDSKKAIETIEGLKQHYTDYAEAFSVALDLLTDGYTTDQSRIDSDIQTYKDSVAQQIADLIQRAEKAEAEVAQLALPTS